MNSLALGICILKHIRDFVISMKKWEIQCCVSHGSNNFIAKGIKIIGYATTSYTSSSYPIKSETSTNRLGMNIVEWLLLTGMMIIITTFDLSR
jgi:hypothetical protein